MVHTYAGHGLERIFKSRQNPSGEASNTTSEVKLFKNNLTRVETLLQMIRAWVSLWKG